MRIDPEIDRSIFNAPSFSTGVGMKKPTPREAVGIAKYIADVSILIIGALIVIVMMAKRQPTEQPATPLNDAEFVRRYMENSNDLKRFERILQDARREITSRKTTEDSLD